MTDDERHAPLFKTPKQLIIGIVLSFVVPVVVILILAYMVAGLSRESVGASSDEHILNRIAPVADVQFKKVQSTSGGRSGQTIYDTYCMSCHATGVADAPKTGDQAAWSSRLRSGIDALLATVISGKGAMPPRGAASDASDEELKAAVKYLANKSGGNF